MLLYAGLFLSGAIVGGFVVFVWHGNILGGIQTILTDIKNVLADIQNRLPK